METTQVFFTIDKPCLDNEWNQNITSGLKQMTGIDNIEVIEQNETSKAQINISCNSETASLNDIAMLIRKSGAMIEEMIIHFPSGISGISDVYGARNSSFSIKENLKKISSVKGVGISSEGIIKVEINPETGDKQELADNIIRAITSVRLGNV